MVGQRWNGLSWFHVGDIMALTEHKDIFITVHPDGQFEIRTKTTIREDGLEVGSRNFRRVLHPGANYDNESAMVRDIARVVHTPERIAAFRVTAGAPAAEA